jgi:hypothetical protein
VAGKHLGHHQAGAETATELAERAIGDAGHGGQDQAIGERIRADANHRHGVSLPQGQISCWKRVAMIPALGGWIKAVLSVF